MGNGNTGRGRESAGRLSATVNPGDGIEGKAGSVSAGIGNTGRGKASDGSEMLTAKPGEGISGSAGSVNDGIGKTGSGSASGGSGGKSHTDHFAMKTQDEATPLVPSAP